MRIAAATREGRRVSITGEVYMLYVEAGGTTHRMWPLVAELSDGAVSSIRVQPIGGGSESDDWREFRVQL